MRGSSLDLIEKSFEAAGVAFSNEGIIETVRKFFNWVKEKLVQLKDWFIGLFTSSKKKTESTKMISLSNKIVGVIYGIYAKLMNIMLGTCDRMMRTVPAFGWHRINIL